MIFTEVHQYTGKAMRIVSLVPSITELLHYLELNEEVVGITKFCIHPESWFRNKIRVGGTKNIDIQIIEYLKPDLIIANKEENVKDQVNLLKNKFEIFLTDVGNLKDNIGMIENIGFLCNKIDEAANLVVAIRKEFSMLTTFKKPLIKTAYLIWKDPLMTIGGDTFVNDMLFQAGFKNIFSDMSRYPEVSIPELQLKKPDLIFLSSEPYPFKQSHADWLQQLIPDAKIMLVDGEMFSWYGSHLLQAPVYFNSLRNQLNIG